MRDALASWIEANPRAIAAMGLPLLLIVGNALLSNPVYKTACGILTGGLVCAVTLILVIAGQWNLLIWPCFGVVAWAIIAGIAKSMD